MCATHASVEDLFGPVGTILDQKKRYNTLGEKFKEREDVIVELRARMNEYEVGVSLLLT